MFVNIKEIIMFRRNNWDQTKLYIDPTTEFGRALIEIDAYIKIDRYDQALEECRVLLHKINEETFTNDVDSLLLQTNIVDAKIKSIKALYPKVREPINVIVHRENVSVDWYPQLD